jgi:hypothetical protein
VLDSPIDKAGCGCLIPVSGAEAVVNCGGAKRFPVANEHEDDLPQPLPSPNTTLQKEEKLGIKLEEQLILIENFVTMRLLIRVSNGSICGVWSEGYVCSLGVFHFKAIAKTTWLQ